MAKQQILINNSNRIDTGSVALIKELRKAGIIKSARKRRAPKDILAVNDATGGADTVPTYRTVMQAPTDIYQRIPDRETPLFGRFGPNDLGRNQLQGDVVRQQAAGQNAFGEPDRAQPANEGAFEARGAGIRQPQEGIKEERGAGVNPENIKRGGGGGRAERPSIDEVIELIFNDAPRLRIGYDAMYKQPAQRLRFLLKEYFGLSPALNRNQEDLKEIIISEWVKRQQN